MSDIESHTAGTYASWEIVSETIAIKQCDKSVFERHVSAISHEINWFFRADSLDSGTKRNIKLLYGGKEYDAYIEREKHELSRTRIFWHKDLGDEFADYNEPGNYPRLKFERIADDVYDISVLEDTKLNKKAVEVAKALLTLIATGQTKISYSDLSNMTESKPSPYYEMNKLLDAINRRCNHLGLPSISAMVVNKGTDLPGEGFRQLCIDAFGYAPSMTLEEIVDAELKKIQECDSWGKLADSLGIKMPYDGSKLPEEMEEEVEAPIVEGAKRTITVNSYERDPRAKKKCKEYYLKKDGRITCQVCGFDFGKVYGPEYDNMIHVHHIVPVSEIGEEYEVDPVKDLIPVCPNCHMVLHAGAEITIDELKMKIRKGSVLL